GFMTSCVPPVLDPQGVAYSSTRAREALSAGDVETAASILGRPFQIEGTVIQGDQRGRTIGFPTANIPLGEYIRPMLGVYAVRAELPGGDMVSGVANIGKRPTVDGLDERLEVHLFDFAGDLYGRNLNIHLQRFIRPEQKFANFEELKTQIVRDAETARHVLQEQASTRL
ncbi:MAG: riboflavin kinase, partial [Rhodospirillales bacterium]